MDWVGLLGRVLMSAIFIQGGILKAMAPAGTIAYFAHDGLPVPGAAYAVALLVEIGGGILFLAGWRVRPVALVLAIWCIATAMVAHYHPENRDAMIHFMKNVCMAGGFLQVVAFGAGRLSLDRR
ncbi:MAG: putative oxidoreductase [Acetobacteraceae bacterium]|jgi:putative oxidoreductase|nr:putative oxidoreductase [Acetobacteraceae bacterium]MEA2767137.1 putative oxidoreductase [Acetobacteraceae bacterium]